jgi:uncharacterized protein (TIGR03067 family)
MRHFLAAVLLLTASAIADDNDKDLKGDLKGLQGNWSAMVGPNKDIPLMLNIKGVTLSYQLTTPDGQEIKFSGKLKLDEKAKPKTMDLTNLSGANNEDVADVEALYELNDDEFKSCSGNPGSPRPKEFKEDEDNMIRITVFKRVKDEKKDK